MSVQYYKKVHWFTRMSVTTIYCVLGPLLQDNVLMGASSLYIVTYIIDLCTMKTCHWIFMSMFDFVKSRHNFQFSPFIIVLLLCLRRNQSVSLEC